MVASQAFTLVLAVLVAVAAGGAVAATVGAGRSRWVGAVVAAVGLLTAGGVAGAQVWTPQAQLAAHLQGRYGVVPVGPVRAGGSGTVTLQLQDGSRASCRIAGTAADPVVTCGAGELPRMADAGSGR